MKQQDFFGLLALAGLGIAVYKLAHPKCPWCDEALALIKVGERVTCPSCRNPVSALQAVLA